MIITDLMKLDKVIKVEELYLKEECKTTYSKLYDFVTKFKYTEIHGYYLIENWLRAERDLGIELNVNPSTIGNKKGKMTKEIELVLPRRMVKRLRKINDKITTMRINNEEIDPDLLEDLQDIENIIDIANFNLKDKLPSFLYDFYEILDDCKNVEVSSDEYTLIEVQSEIVELANLSISSVYLDLITRLDTDKLRYVMNTLFKESETEEQREIRNSMINTIREIIETDEEEFDEELEKIILNSKEESDNIIQETY